MADTLYTSDATTQAAIDTLTSVSDLGVFDQVRNQLAEYGLEDLANEVLRLVTTYGSDMKETIKAELRKTAAYQNRFAGNIQRVQQGKTALSEAEYLYNERAYEEAFGAYKASDLATRANFADLIAKSVSPAELSARFSVAYDRVQSADPALKNQLRAMYPGISDNDLARSLLMGADGSQYLQKKIGQAEILAEADIAGINLKSSAEELQARGVTREKAAAGLQAVAQYKTGLESSARTFGETVSPDTIQKELESEVLLGQQSARNKRLASQARAEFGGQSGITTGSLRRTTSGSQL